MVALVLAGVGIYGAMAYAVSRRTREIGLRMALGARAQDVMRLVLGQTMGVTLLGIAFGLGGALAAVFGLFEGYLSFRYGLKGPYFSLVTLAFAEMLRVIAVNTKAVSNDFHHAILPTTRMKPAISRKLAT